MLAEVLSSTAQWIKFQIASLTGAVGNFGPYFLDRLIDDLLGFAYVKFEINLLRSEKVFMFTTKGV